MERFARVVVAHARLVLVAFVLGLLIAGGVGAAVFGRLQSQGYSDPGSPSAHARAVLAGRFGVTDPLVVLAVRTPTGVDAPAGAQASQTLVARVAAEPGVHGVVSYWTSGHPAQLRGQDGRTGQVLVYPAPSAGASDTAALARTLTRLFGGAQPGGLAVQVAGAGAVGNAINDQITADLARADSIAIPLTAVLLVIVFGSLVSALLPFTVAAGAILGSFLVLFLITLGTDVSVFALNLVTGLGLGLGIDYALLVVNRFREEVKGGAATQDAVVATVASAGRAVLVSGLTVAATLAALLVFPQYFLRSFAYAGVSVTLLAVASALVALPAVLTLLGPRVNALKVRRGDLAPRDEGAWARVARLSMRHPWPVLVVVIAGLAVLASPARHAAFSQVDDRTLPATSPVAVASDTLRSQFPGQASAPIDVVVPGGAADPAALGRYASALSAVPGIVQVTTPSSVVVHGQVVAPNPAPATWTAGTDARLQLVGDVAPRTPAGQSLVTAVRAVPAPVAGALVGGVAADYTDAQAAIVSHLPVALGWIVAATLLVLFLYTGSVVLPVKAVLLNVLSLSATLGVLVWVFQMGHLMGLVGSFTVTGSIDTSTLVLIAVVAFALSMDYEVFLLSRIKELHDQGMDTTAAVALGLQRSGRIITAAALLLAVVFASFVTSGVTSIKMLGLGVAVAVLLDATVVRGLLVPAFMRLAGRWNWWAPAPLRRIQRRFALADA